MKSYKILAAGAVLLALVSCSKSTRISGTLSDAPGREVIVKLLDVNRYSVLDTLTTDAQGRFSCKVDVSEGQPEFIYLFSGDTKLASLLLEAGDKVTVVADTLGNYEVEGSEESLRLRQVEQSFSSFASGMIALSEEYDAAQNSESQRASVNTEITRLFINHYRECIKYINTYPKSLTCIPVLYESLNEYSPVFSQPTDALHFRMVCDSLKTVYPESRYVKALEKETARRENLMHLNMRIGSADPVGFPEIEMPDQSGRKVKLSTIEAKVILLHFWDASEPTQKMLNIDELLPIYKQYHSRGFEIYSVCVTPDKSLWASVLKAQKLPWINVNDGLGAGSPAIRLYNITAAPTSFLIADGSIRDVRLSGPEALKKELSKLLK